MIVVGWLVLVAIVLWGLDRILLAAEESGHVYWRRRKASPGATGNALLNVQAIFEPDKRHVVEVRQDERAAVDDEGEPPRS